MSAEDDKLIDDQMQTINTLRTEGAIKDTVIQQALVACESCMTHSAHISARDAIEAAAGILRDARVSTPQDQDWISVEDRLPPPHHHFLALNSNGYIFESCMCYGMHEPWFTYPRGDGRASNTAPAWIDVTHWMEKPEPPKGLD